MIINPTKLMAVKLEENPYNCPVNTWLLYTERIYHSRGGHISCMLRDYLNGDIKNRDLIKYDKTYFHSSNKLTDKIFALHYISEQERNKKSLDEPKDFDFWHSYLMKFHYLTPGKSVKYLYHPTSYETDLIFKVLDKAEEGGYGLKMNGCDTIPLPEIFLSFEEPPAIARFKTSNGIYKITVETIENLTDKIKNIDKLKSLIDRELPEETLRGILKELGFDEKEIEIILEYAKKIISIEELLGVYIPSDKQIILYDRGIDWFAAEKNLDKILLRAVVLVHEIGHWVTHVLPKYPKCKSAFLNFIAQLPGFLEWSLQKYIDTDNEVKEGWAQLITWWIVNNVGGELKRTFEKLNQNQSSPYLVFKKYTGYDVKRVMDSLEKLRNLRRPAKLSDWDNVI